jgi:predicted nucleic acid-binding protein
VLGEAYTYLRARDGYGVALNAVEGVRASGVATIEFIDRDFDRRIWDTIREFAGVPLSYVDASLVVLGQRLRLRRVFSFDDDLRQAGLELVP